MRVHPSPKRAQLLAKGVGILTVDLRAIIANWRYLAKQAPKAECAAVLKADAYGLGAEKIGTALAAAGCKLFFVANIEEAIALRKVIPGAEIAVLNGLITSSADYHRWRLLPVLNELRQVRRWHHEGQQRPAILQVDTGAHRLGMQFDEVVRTASTKVVRDITWRAIISHLACADEPSHPLNSQQLERFKGLRPHFPEAPLSLAASSGIFLGKHYHFDVLRPGAALFGINPQPGKVNPLRPVVRLHCPILDVVELRAGQSIGYGATHTLRHRGRIATIALGYADGYPRSASNTGKARIKGCTVPVVGRVSMDLVTLDVSRVPERHAARGSLVSFIDEEHDVDQLARESGTIGYEILCRLGRRFSRRYISS